MEWLVDSGHLENMRRRAIPLACLITLAAVTSCGGERGSRRDSAGGAVAYRTPRNDSVLIDASATTPDGLPRPLPLIAAVAEFERKHGTSESPGYPYALTDLDGDQRDDAVVLLSGPNWCGSGGCEMLVFRGVSSGFMFVSSSSVTSEPVRILSETANGWRTLIVNSTAKGNVLLRFNGNGYPSNPSLEPSASTAQLAASQLVLALDTAGATTRARPPANRTVRYLCDDTTELAIEFAPDDKFAKVSYGGSTWRLPHLDTGSGAARYADKEISVWNKESGVLLERGGRTSSCAIVNDNAP